MDNLHRRRGRHWPQRRPGNYLPDFCAEACAKKEKYFSDGARALASSERNSSQKRSRERSSSRSIESLAPAGVDAAVRPIQVKGFSAENAETWPAAVRPLW